jgi:LPS export ABC transporter protein LptC
VTKTATDSAPAVKRQKPTDVRLQSIIMLAGLQLTALACFSGRHGPEIETSWEEEGLVQESWGVTFSAYESGNPRLRIHAPHLRRYEKGDSLYMVLEARAPGRVQVFLQEDDRTSVELRAILVTYFESSGEILAEGAVHVISDDGREVQTEHLRWIREEGRLRAPGFVTVLTEDGRISGYGLTASENLSSWTIHRITGEFTVDDPTQ